MLHGFKNRSILKVKTRLPSKLQMYFGNHKECMGCQNTNLIHQVIPKTSGILVTRENFLRSNSTTAFGTAIWVGSVCSRNKTLKKFVGWWKWIQINPKKLFDACKKLDAQPEISQEAESSSSSECETEKSAKKENVSSLLQSLLPDEKYDEFNIFLVSKKTLTKNAGTLVENVHDFEKWEGACLDTGAQATVTGLKQALANCNL